MLPLIFAALVDTVVAPPPDFDIVYIHEWGAVTFTEEEVFFGAAPPGGLTEVIDPDVWEEPLARAPVVYFYGAPFSGTFTVSVADGDFVETIPQPWVPEAVLPVTSNSDLPSVAMWRFTSDPYLRHEQPDESGINCIPDDILRIWRRPSSNMLTFEDTSREKFIYYECTLDRELCEDYLESVLSPGDPADDPSNAGPMMRFRMDAGTISVEIYGSGQEPRHLLNPLMNRDVILETLCSWADGTMKSEEIAAMWETWEDWIMSGTWSGEALLIFPLPSDLVERMTTITLETEEDLDLDYSRFYFGVASI